MMLQKKTWVILDQNIISLITYSELVNIARNVGLSIGKFYQIKDKSNALALAITTTKVQYDDSMGNILIDDLGSNIQYHVTSQNLSIDDIRGVFNESNKTLVFRFDEQVPDFTADDYLLGKIQRNNIWSLAKYRLSSFLSKVTGNSITWNGGFYFNFSNTLKNYFDKKGGVVAKDTYDTDMNQLNLSIQNVGKANQEITGNAAKAIADATTPTAIYDKQLPTALETGGEATDAAKGDKLIIILSKFQRYINKFKYATGIKVTSDFSPTDENIAINNNDTVDTALRKVAKYMKGADNIKVSSDKLPVLVSKPSEITKDDTVMEALAKLVYLVNHIDKTMLMNNTIDFNKIAKAGVLPTDIFRLELTTSFDFTGGGIGGCVVQGYSNDFFAQTDEYPYNPYRLKLYYNSTFPKILAFIPVTPVIPNVTNNYAAAGSFVHYTEGDITLQFIFQIPKSTYDSLYSAGNRYFKCVVQADIYNSKTDEQIFWIAMNYVNISTINIRQSTLIKGNEQHIIFKMSITPTASNS